MDATTTTATADRKASERRDRAASVALIRAYEAVCGNPRDPGYRAAHDNLAARVRERGFLQYAGWRYLWSRGEASLVRLRVGPPAHHREAPDVL